MEMHKKRSPYKMVWEWDKECEWWLFKKIKKKTDEEKDYSIVLKKDQENWLSYYKKLGWEIKE